MRFSRWLLLSAAAPLVLAGCDGFGRAMTAHTDVVARAAGQELRVEEAAELLSANPQIPAEPQVVQALADIWVDYTLLATAAEEDSTLAVIDMDRFTQAAREQMVILKLRNQVIQPDTTVTDEELQELWRTQGPGAEIRARHILLRLPASATEAQRDSVLALAESLRDRAVGGEDFAALAAQFSQDPGSAERGGDLGFFSRGRMVAPFEEVAFALEPGEVSEVVESPFGFHVILLEERRQQELEPVRDEFRAQLVQRAAAEAETAYLDSLSAAAGTEIDDDGIAVVREIADQPGLVLRGRAAEREIASYEGGALTSGEFAEFFRTQPPQYQAAFPTATAEQLEGVIQQLVRKELLLQEAGERGVELTPAEQDSLRAQAQQAVRQLVQTAGFGPGGADTAAVETQVRNLLRGAIGGTQQLVPLGQLSFVLREAYGAEVNETSFAEVVAEIEEMRGASALPPAVPAGTPGAVPDTLSGQTAAPQQTAEPQPADTSDPRY